MAVKVLVTRRIKEGALVDAALVLAELRGKATAVPGYLTGETLESYDVANKLLVISTWDSVDDWRRWRDSPERLAAQAKLEPYLQGPEQQEVFHLGLRPGR